MRILLDTNIVIHREAATVVNDDIGVLFRWLDDLHLKKCIHPLTVEELEKHKDATVNKSMRVKLANYNILKTMAPLSAEVNKIIDELDVDQNDVNDTLILNELYCNRVDALITEDKKLLKKALFLGIADKVYTIETFLEKVNAEHPDLADYKILSVRKDRFGNLDLNDDFFDTLKDDYPGFEEWFNYKADEEVYVCYSGDDLIAFLFLKVEGEGENYSDMVPPLSKKKRLKIGTFKVSLNGFRLGERFLKIVFDNATRYSVDEIYVTIFNKHPEQRRLITLFENYGFYPHGIKRGSGGDELVYVRSFDRVADVVSPKLTYPFYSTSKRIFIVPIRPEYHTELFPDSILKTESPDDFVENEPHRNAISKVYISRSIQRNLNTGDVIVFYRTGGYYKSVVSTIGVVESVIDGIINEDDFIRLCRKRSVFSDEALSEQWNYKRMYRPFIVNFLYAYSFPKRINMKRLIELGIIQGVDEAPRGFMEISVANLEDILRETESDESLVIY